MSIDVDKAKLSSAYGGKTYCFCSEACRRAFDKEPAKYASPAAQEPLEMLKVKYDANPNDIKIAREYGDQLLKAGQIEVAKTLFERLDKIVTAKPDKADVIFQLGYVAMKERRYDDALAQWKIILDGYGDTERFSAAAVDTAAIRYQIEDELDPAYDLLSKALGEGRILGKHLGTAFKLMFMITYDKQDYAAAKAYLEKMPQDARGDEHIADSFWVVYLKTGESAKGEAMLSELFAKVKNNYFALYRLAAIAAEAKVKLLEARGWIERSNELSKGEKFFVLDIYATILWENGQKKKAVNTLASALKICKNPAALKEMKKRLAKYRADINPFDSPG